MQICGMGACLASNVLGADSPPAFSENFEGEGCRVSFFAGDPQHQKLNGGAVVTEQAHSGKQSCMMDITTDGDYALPFLYFAGEIPRVVPKPGQRLEGWIKVDKATSADVFVSLGISVTYPEGKESGRMSAQLPLKVVEPNEGGWQKFQSEDLLDFYTKVARREKWNPEGLVVDAWLLHLTGDLKNKHVVVYIDDILIREETDPR